MSRFSNEAKIKIRPQIRQEIQEGLQLGAQWMIRMRNTATEEVFALYVGNGRSPRQEFARYLALHGDNFDPFECYDFSQNIEHQIIQDSTTNWDHPTSPPSGNYSQVVPYNGAGPHAKDET